MTLDQFFLYLIAALAWPLVALISGTAFVHGIRLLVEAANDWRRTWLEGHLLIEERRTRTATAVARLQQPPAQVLGHDIERQTRMAERALELILGVNGGIPARQQDDATRMLVREIRKMYAELEKPTSGPAAADRYGEQDQESANPFGYGLEPDGDLE